MIPLRFLRQITYSRVHLAYVVLLSLIGGAIIYAIELSGDAPISYIDAMVMAASAATVTGMSVVNTNTFRSGSFAVLMILVQLGSAVMMSTVPLLWRQRYLRRKWGSRIQSTKELSLRDDDVMRKSVDWTLPTFETEMLEYEAGIKLVKVVWAYMLTVYVVTFTILSIYLRLAPVHEVMSEGQFHALGWAASRVIEAFNNAGFSLAPLPLQYDVVVLLTLSAAMLLGNVMYPIALRFCVYLCYRVAADKKHWSFLLAHPRVCYTAMFPALSTRLLLLAAVFTTLLQWVVMMAVDWEAASVAFLPGGQKAVVLLFQVVSTRTAGFQTINYNTFSPTTQLLTAVMMYLATVPAILTLHTSQLNDRTSIDLSDRGPEPSLAYRVWKWLTERRFLVTDSVLLLFWTLVITTIEGRRLIDGVDSGYSLWKLVFEVLSAYGTVGLTLGYHDLPCFTSALYPASRIFIAIIMIQGRHRGMPSDLDVAVNAELGAVESLPAEAMIPYTPSMARAASVAPAVGTASHVIHLHDVLAGTPRPTGLSSYRKPMPVVPGPLAVADSSESTDDADGGHGEGTGGGDADAARTADTWATAEASAAAASPATAADGIARAAAAAGADTASRTASVLRPAAPSVQFAGPGPRRRRQRSRSLPDVLADSADRRVVVTVD